MITLPPELPPECSEPEIRELFFLLLEPHLRHSAAEE